MLNSLVGGAMRNEWRERAAKGAGTLLHERGRLFNVTLKIIFAVREDD